MGLSGIPKSLLPHTIEVRLPIDSDYGGEFSEEGFTITNVRFVSFMEASRSGYVLSDGAKGVIFIDKAKSGNAMGLPIGTLVRFGENEMTVSKCSEFVGFMDIHHWEVEVA